jgi:hypothetical protein
MKKKHGGARQGAGKPAQFEKPMKRKEVMLDEETINFYLVIGEGNLSKGIRQYWRGLTQPAPDAGESAPLQALSTPEHSATSQNLSMLTQRG